MLRRILFSIIILMATVNIWAQPVDIIESVGWLESAFVKWLPLEGPESYNVYYSGEGLTEKRINDLLIRKYDTYYRADILGLKAGSYTIKVVPVISGSEGVGTLTEPITVEAYDRTGFAFSNSRIPGAYKANGTQKDDAVILYITENTKNKVSLNVTGANENPCIGLQSIFEAFAKGDDNRPLIVRLVGQITDLTNMDKGDIVIGNNNNAIGYITIEGVGDDAVADGWGIRVKRGSNIEIRNIGLMNTDSDEGDEIGLQQDNEYIWIHHCDIFYGQAGGDADQDKGDGALDTKTSGFVTISYNHFWDTGKTNLLGNGEEDPRFLTYHHNWYDHSDSRHPRVRSHSVHVYNNYFDGNSKYGVGATLASSVFVEANYFRNCKYPILTSMQGSDVFDEDTQTNDYSDMPTFSKEDGGSIKAYNNFMTGQQRFVSYGDAGYPNSAVDFDAYVAETRDETPGNTVLSYQGTNAYNNFDTNSAVMYAYTPDSPEEAMNKVVNSAGRMNGGDFKWTFNNTVDDASYTVIPELKAALLDYETSLIAIQGDSTSSGSEPGDTIVNPGDKIHNFTLSGTASTFYNITGNLSTSKGTVEYAGLTLTQCLKIESTTSILFTTTQEATLTLVFNTDFTGTIKLNGTSYTANTGILTVTIPAGAYEISKGETANLFYMSIVENTVVIENSSIAELILYPNPAIDEITMPSDIVVERIEIYSLTGVLVKSIEDNIKTIDVSNLIRGTYLLKVNTEQGIFKQTVIIK